MLKYRTKLSLLVILLMPLLISLGLWQLSRYQQKLDLEQMFQERLVMSPVSFPDIKNFTDPIYLPVKIVGHFDSGRYFLRDNQVYEGKVGYEVLMPFLTSGGQWLLVNRGWVGSASREILPHISTPQTAVEIKGTVYRPLGKAFTLGEDVWTDDWPKRIQALDFEKAGRVLGQKIPTMLLVLNDNEPAALQVRPLAFKTTSAKHLGYAFQWFTMALVLLGLYLYRITNHRKPDYAGSDH